MKRRESTQTHRLRGTHCPHCAGLSLVELIIAISASAIVVAAILGSWTAMQRHIAAQTQRAVLTDEARGIVQTLANQVRRSPRVMQWSSEAIVFLSATTRDTVRWEFTGEELLRNDAPIPLRDPQTYIAAFSIESNQSEYQATAGPMVLLFKLLLENDRGDQVSARSAAAIQKPPHEAEDDEDDWYWNF